MRKLLLAILAISLFPLPALADVGQTYAPYPALPATCDVELTTNANDLRVRYVVHATDGAKTHPATVQVSARLHVPETKEYQFSLSGNGIARLDVAGTMVAGLATTVSGRTSAPKGPRISLKQGEYTLVAILSNPKANDTNTFTIRFNNKLFVFNEQATCRTESTSVSTGTVASGLQSPITTNPTTTSGLQPPLPTGRVAGVSTLDYTRAVALYKTADSPAVYAILENGHRHYIASPASFAQYGYNFSDVQTVSRATLERYPEARLLRTPDQETVYLLYPRSAGKWLKLAIPTPTAFVSYPKNEWGNITVVNELDLAAYPDAVVVKTPHDPGVYLIKNGKKHLFISAHVFEALGYSWSEIVTITPAHLDTYATGKPIG